MVKLRIKSFRLVQTLLLVRLVPLASSVVLVPVPVVVEAVVVVSVSVVLVLVPVVIEAVVVVSVVGVVHVVGLEVDCAAIEFEGGSLIDRNSNINVNTCQHE